MPPFMTLFFSNINRFNLMIFNLDDRVNDVLGMQPISTQSRNQYYDILNINSQNLIANTYDFFFWLVVFAFIDATFSIGLFLVRMQWSKANNFLMRLTARIQSMIHYNGYIALINGNFVVLACSCCLNLRILNYQSAGEGFSSILAILTSGSILIYIGWSFYFLETRRTDLGSEELRKEFKELYEGLRTDQEDRPYFYYQLIMIRRLAFVIVIVTLEDYPVLQYNIILFYLGFHVSFKLITLVVSHILNQGEAL